MLDHKLYCKSLKKPSKQSLEALLQNEGLDRVVQACARAEATANAES